MGLVCRIQFGCSRWCGASFAFQSVLFALLNEALSNADDAASVDAQDITDVGVGSSSVGIDFVGQQEDPSMKDLLGLSCAVAGNLQKTLTLGCRQLNVVFVARLRSWHGLAPQRFTEWATCDILA